MPQQKNGKTVTTTTTVKTAKQQPRQPQQQQSAKQQRKRKPRQVQTPRRMPAWACAVANPFNHEPVAIPDETTQPTLKCSSLNFDEFSTYATVANTNHGALVGILPYALDALSRASSSNGVASIQELAWVAATNTFTFDTVASPVIRRGQANASSIFPGVDGVSTNTNDTGLWLHRPTALKVRITPKCPELYRGGDIVGGIAEIDTANGSANTSNVGKLNALSLLTNTAMTSGSTATISPAEVMNRLRRIAMVRQPDGAFEFTWIPTGVPSYQPLMADQAPFMWFKDAPVLIFMIEGDQTATASIAGNAFRMETMWHWEVIPATQVGHALRPTPSPCDFVALSACLNEFEKMSTTVVETGGRRIAINDLRSGQSSAPSDSWETFKSVKSAVGSVVQAAADTLSNPVVQDLLYRGASQGMARIAH